jgi:hypothetical protein
MKISSPAVRPSAYFPRSDSDAACGSRTHSGRDSSSILSHCPSTSDSTARDWRRLTRLQSRSFASTTSPTDLPTPVTSSLSTCASFCPRLRAMGGSSSRDWIERRSSLRCSCALGSISCVSSPLLDSRIYTDGIHNHRREDQRTSTLSQDSSDSPSPSEGTTSNSDSPDSRSAWDFSRQYRSISSGYARTRRVRRS